jgi:hypothetical protein
MFLPSLHFGSDADLQLWAEMTKSTELVVISRNVTGSGGSEWSLVRQLFSGW